MRVVDAAAAKKRIFDLAVPLENGMPSSGHHPAFTMALVRRHGDKVRQGGGGATSANEIIATGCHVGTHIDAIGHWAVEGCIHGGLDASEITRGGKFRKGGSDEIEPMVCRGVFLDVPGIMGVSRLEPGYGITPYDLEQALGNLSLNPGDVALIRTGWPQLYHDPTAFLHEPKGIPGVTGSAAEWLAQHGIRAAGTDTPAFDQIVPGPTFQARPAHTVLLFKNAIHIIEMLNLEELAKEKIPEFLFILSPLKLVGATGSPVRPLAVIDAA